MATAASRWRRYQTTAPTPASSVTCQDKTRQKSVSNPRAIGSGDRYGTRVAGMAVERRVASEWGTTWITRSAKLPV